MLSNLAGPDAPGESVNVRSDALDEPPSNAGPPTLPLHGIVLAGVHQWDESALDAQVPRPLLPVNQVPLIGYPLRWLCTGGITSVTVCANSSSRLVRRCVGDGSQIGLTVDYYEDWTPRGPAGCVRDAGLDRHADRYVVTDGTIVPQVNLQMLVAAHVRSKATVTVAVDHEPEPAAGPGALRPVGIYVFERAALELVSPRGYQDIKEILIPRLRQRAQRVLPYHVEGPCPRITGFETYLQVSGWMLERLASQSPLPGYQRYGDAQVHERARLAPSVRLLGPVLVGPDCTVNEHATIVGPAVLGERCAIGKRSVICRSILWDSGTVSHDAFLDRCVLGHRAAVAARSFVLNRYVAARSWSSPTVPRLAEFLRLGRREQEPIAETARSDQALVALSEGLA